MHDDTNSSDTKRTDASVSNIRNDASSKDASSGQSSYGREPQQGTSIDDRTGQRGGPSGSTDTRGDSER